MGLRASLGSLRDRTRRTWLVDHDVIILRKRLVTPLPTHPGFDVVEHPAFNEGILRLHERFGRDLSPDRLRMRFDRGHRFYELREAERAVATTWAVVSGERFVNEIGLGFPVSPGVAWMRDIFVAPASRRRGLFAVLLDSVTGRFFPAAQTLWSAVSMTNKASLRAHFRYGHERVARYEVVHVLGRVLLRLRWPATPAVGSYFEISRRTVITGASYRRFIADRLA